MFNLIDAHKQGLLKAGQWSPNLISGLVVGVVALPLAMAFAIASGAKPEQGIYTAIIAGLIVSSFGGSRLQIAGPTGAFIVILSGITDKYGISGLQTATLIAGFFLMLLGFLKMGNIIKFVPSPVILGFTAGIGVIIWVGQWREFFGLPEATGHHFHENLLHLVRSLPGLHLPTTLLALLSWALVVYSPRIHALRRIPGPLTAVLLASLLQAIFGFENVRTIGTAFGGIPSGLPSLHVPDLGINRVIELLGPAFTIAILGAIESLLSAVVADGMAGTKHNSNQELLGQGLANIVCPFFGGFASTGAIARTATNIRNGATSPISGIVHSIVLILILVFCAPLAVNVPLATLAAILFVVAWTMSEPRHFLTTVIRAPRSDVAILLITFGLTIFCDIVVAVNCGVALAIIIFLRRMAESVEIRHSTGIELSSEFEHQGFANLPAGVLAFAVEGPFFFAAVGNLERALANTNNDPEILIFRLRWMPFIDFTGIQTLEEVIINLQKRGVRVMIAGANSEVRKKLEKARIIELVGQENFHVDFKAALTCCQKIHESSSVSQPIFDRQSPEA